MDKDRSNSLNAYKSLEMMEMSSWVIPKVVAVTHKSFRLERQCKFKRRFHIDDCNKLVAYKSGCSVSFYSILAAVENKLNRERTEFVHLVVQTVSLSFSLFEHKSDIT